MMSENRIYQIGDSSYNVLIVRKRIKNSYLRLNKDMKTFTLTTSKLAPIKSLDKFVINSIPKLLKKKQIVNQPIGEDFIYILGKKESLDVLNGTDPTSFLRKNFLPLVTSRVRYFEDIMGIKKPYGVRVRNNKTRFGSNAKRSHSLSFALCLYHYDLDVIDSVVVHELAHGFYFDHSKKFYDVVYKYCPNYNQLRVRLIKKRYGKDNI